MIPSYFVRLEALPLTANRKIDFQALALNRPVRSTITPAASTGTEVRQIIANTWAEVLNLEEPGPDDNFFDVGGHSLLTIKVQHKLQQQLNRDIAVVDLFNYPTIRSLAQYLEQGETRAQPGEIRQPGPKENPDIAIIGMACRFPGADSPAEFWQNLCSGIESIRFFSDEELKDAGVDPQLLENPNYIKARAILKDIETFDASFFDISPREAEIMDPQHRFFLEISWEWMDFKEISI